MLLAVNRLKLPFFDNLSTSHQLWQNELQSGKSAANWMLWNIVEYLMTGAKDVGFKGGKSSYR